MMDNEPKHAVCGLESIATDTQSSVNRKKPILKAKCFKVTKINADRRGVMTCSQLLKWIYCVLYIKVMERLHSGNHWKQKP